MNKLSHNSEQHYDKCLKGLIYSMYDLIKTNNQTLEIFHNKILTSILSYPDQGNHLV